MPNSHRRLLDVLGGEAGCRRLAKDFYAMVASSKELKPLFPGKNLRCATEEFSAFLIQLLEGDATQTQYRWWLGLRESHARFQISQGEQAAWLSLMRQALHSVVGDSEARSALDRFFKVASDYILRQEDGDIEHRELKRRWAKQRALDQLVESLVNGDDREAIVLARRFASEPSVFVGIMARMVEAGRKPLIEFVIASARRDERLSGSRFKGRTLLHFAAGSSCLPVVQHLLAAGTDPNILDGGGHSPLYRAAGSNNGAKGACIVRALLEAGANVDACGGVNRSTALHEAARHGNVQAARALLDAGASVKARDKKGLTPLDRAANCRRRKVAALLASR